MRFRQFDRQRAHRDAVLIAARVTIRLRNLLDIQPRFQHYLPDSLRHILKRALTDSCGRSGMRKVFNIQKSRLLDRDSLTAEDGELYEPAQFVDRFPLIEIGILIVTDDPDKVVVRILFFQRLHRRDRIGGRRQIFFNQTKLHFAIGPQRLFHHYHTQLKGRQFPVLQRCFQRRDKPDLIQSQAFKRGFRDCQMTVVDRIEGSSQ